MKEIDPIVFIVDDDLSVRRSPERLVRSTGVNVLRIPDPPRD
jgi:FixJ family two-component response regulator